ncbi:MULTISPECIES: 4a-hydroxytetrahydrobiopterin dehydratase [Alphaproteobacteria]|uniref:Putative pterin-4-alpha-carbinolamine dehydratase n=2 Tax=Alphaproteobacteria TaxID=28211 RepID=A0A512HJS6_9HYPH|nr:MULTISPECIES: 4a-hydroxytetrahydrobiopterin dehydratase [Alphaproteobacteria]GEO85706.1 putative pterin-4-alpha-carbinolamine dehydratase [Ciceribacter naphthalenivorans]GLR21935.1 putative pterin-4-alpha-carbinolamine dehydratase [Ciceribacter naphthalenivorans]GLT04791.1 putative pterin-4-alpha-carbinolamine dehydratase [Sphingomonas psychrolutea]
MTYEKLDYTAIGERLDAFPHWSLASDGKAISRRFVFADFVEAFAFMTRVALAAERLNHHPDWSNVYRRVDVTLTSHSVKGLTELDFQLAAVMDGATGPGN